MSKKQKKVDKTVIKENNNKTMSSVEKENDKSKATIEVSEAKLTKEEVNDSEVKVKKSVIKNDERTKTSLFMALILVPIIILATIQNYLGSGAINTVFEIYNFIFEVLVGLILIYAMYELINFITPKEENRKLFTTNMLLATIPIGLAYFLPLWNEVFNFIGVGFLSISLFGSNSLILLLLLAVIIISVTINLDLKETILILITSFILLAFFNTFVDVVINGGWETTLLMVSVVICSDVAAYYGGQKFGKKKIFPEVSPNKTTEGFLIGFLSAVTIGYIIFIILFIGFNAIASGALAGSYGSLTGNDKYWWFLLIPVVALAAPMGDLYFSKIKRMYDKKDFSNILPGHGGLLDRIDSHIFAFTTLGLTASLVVMV